MVQSKGLENKVVLWGSKFGKDKDELMQQMDVFVHPSRNEGLPSSVLEAASLGIPCLVSKATNVGSYVLRHQAGYVIDNENSEQLRKKLEVLYLIKKIDSLRKMGAGAKKMIEHSFSWDSIVREFDQLYQVA
jgi:glycosyltransferase involved in cell wall biosynthesis